MTFRWSVRMIVTILEVNAGAVQDQTGQIASSMAVEVK